MTREEAIDFLGKCAIVGLRAYPRFGTFSDIEWQQFQKHPPSNLPEGSPDYVVSIEDREFGVFSLSEIQQGHYERVFRRWLAEATGK